MQTDARRRRRRCRTGRLFHPSSPSQEPALVEHTLRPSKEPWTSPNRVPPSVSVFFCTLVSSLILLHPLSILLQPQSYPSPQSASSCPSQPRRPEIKPRAAQLRGRALYPGLRRRAAIASNGNGSRATTLQYRSVYGGHRFRASSLLPSSCLFLFLSCLRQLAFFPFFNRISSSSPQDCLDLRISPLFHASSPPKRPLPRSSSHFQLGEKNSIPRGPFFTPSECKDIRSRAAVTTHS